MYVIPPHELISYEGGNANFRCFSLVEIVEAQWLVNGSILEDLDLDNAIPDFDHGSGSLVIYNLTLNFNMTRIQCVGKSSSGNSIASSEATLLLLQG